ncbi:MAG: hypothetical protein ACOYL6_07785 [Bacteriovoracaceae bacterium]
MEKKLRTDEEISMMRFIELGRMGHYPLFFMEWIEESVQSPKVQLRTSSLPTTKEYVYKVFSELEKHKNIERKKTYLEKLNKDDRIKFIKSFLYLVELRSLDKVGTLH